MDYLFVPGGGKDEDLGRQVIGRRPNTLTIALPGAQNNVAGLIAKLGGAGISHPIGDILLVAHGLEAGGVTYPLSAQVGSPCDYEKALAADAANTIRLPPALLRAAPADPLQTITCRLRPAATSARRAPSSKDCKRR